MQIRKSMHSRGKVSWVSISLPTYLEQVNNVQKARKGARGVYR